MSMLEGRMKESHHSMLGTSPSPISFLGAISASLVDAWIPVFFAAWAISHCNLSNWAWLRSRSMPDRHKLRKVALNHVLVLRLFQILRLKQPLTCGSLGVKSNLGSYSLSDLLKAPLLVELEGPARTLSWCNKHTLVEIGGRLQVLSRLLLQLLAELLPLHRSNVRYTDGGQLIAGCQNKMLLHVGV